MSTAIGRFEAIGTSHRILVTDPTTLPEAVRTAQAYLAELDAAASCYRPDSEVRRIAARAGATVRVEVSALLADHLDAVLRAAALTDGLVDPTVGAAVRGGEGPVSGWRSVALAGRVVTVPAGTLIDVGSVGKAHAADRIAADLAERLPGGFLVDLGGDLAVSGEVPDGGWRVGVELADGTVAQVVTTHASGIATSSTRLRRWAGPDGERHHVLDPRTGRTAPSTWAQVTCAAASAWEANAMSLAAIVLGPDAPAWLGARGVAARLDTVNRVVIATARWPVSWQGAAA